MGALRLYMVGNDKSIETTWTGGLNRSLNDRQTKVQFWLQLVLQLKANFKMTGVFSQSPPLSQKGKWAAISPHRELLSLHRLTKASVGNLPASGLSHLPTQTSNVKCGIGWSKDSWDKRSWADLPGAMGICVWGLTTQMEVWHHKGHLQLRLLSEEPEAW